MIKKLFLKKFLRHLKKPVSYAPLPGSLAQLVEQLAFNQLVAGSNPARPTIFQKDHTVVLFYCLLKNEVSLTKRFSSVKSLTCCRDVYQQSFEPKCVRLCPLCLYR